VALTSLFERAAPAFEILKITTNNNNNNKKNMARGKKNGVTMAARLAQSARDRAANAAFTQGEEKRVRRNMRRMFPRGFKGNGRTGGVSQAGTINQLVAAPVAAQRVRVNPPKARNGMSANGNRTIVFEEYVQDIITSGTTLLFAAQSFPLQPGISTLFAWLAEQAINYQEYRFKRVTFRFETDQTTGIAGKVMYAFSPDAADPTPTNKQEMLEYGIKGKSAVWQEFSMPVPLVEALGTRRYIRSGTLSANLDIKTYDLGVLFVATSGIVATSANIGELYVEYEVELITPVVQSLLAAQSRSVTVTGNTAISETAVFGTAPTFVGGLAVTGSSSGQSLIFSRVGNYLVTMDLVGTGLNTVYAPTGVVSATDGGGASAANGSVTQIPGISNAAANVGTEARVAFAIIVLQRGAFFVPNLSPQGTTITASVTRIATFSAV
jgi:hypothetical protein